MKMWIVIPKFSKSIGQDKESYILTNVVPMLIFSEKKDPCNLFLFIPMKPLETLILFLYKTYNKLKIEYTADIYLQNMP
jgi:hypothetical protein